MGGPVLPTGEAAGAEANGKTVGGKRKRSLGALVQNVEDSSAGPSPSKIRDPQSKAQLLAEAETSEDLHFQDVEDEVEEEEIVEDAPTDEDEDDEWEDDDQEMSTSVTRKDEDVDMGDDGDDEEDEEEAQGDGDGKLSTWFPGDGLGEGEKLDYDPKTYHMLHNFELGWSCLSFDILPDDLGLERTSYPHSLYLVAGSQAPTKQQNQIYVVKLSKMYKTNRDAESDDDCEAMSDGEDDSDDYSENPPEFAYRALPHEGTINRLRVCPQQTQFVATWSDTGKVAIWDIKDHHDKLQSNSVTPPKNKDTKKHSSSMHGGAEGFAMDWDPHKAGQLLTGGGDNKIFLYTQVSDGWVAEQQPFVGHQGSVEDVAWLRCGSGLSHVFASASTDNSIRLWDTRQGKKSTSKMLNAHAGDVNVCSWCPGASNLLLSGGDDGVVNCWDMRKPNEAISHVANIGFHRDAVSSVDWHPTDEAIFATSSYDNSIALWDVSVEADDDSGSRDQQASAAAAANPFPDQLMFLHLGQNHISEIKWHPQIPGVVVSTAEDGFNVFKAENM